MLQTDLNFERFWYTASRSKHLQPRLQPKESSKNEKSKQIGSTTDFKSFTGKPKLPSILKLKCKLNFVPIKISITIAQVELIRTHSYAFNLYVEQSIKSRNSVVLEHFLSIITRRYRHGIGRQYQLYTIVERNARKYSRKLLVVLKQKWQFKVFWLNECALSRYKMMVWLINWSITTDTYTCCSEFVCEWLITYRYIDNTLFPLTI